MKHKSNERLTLSKKEVTILEIAYKTGFSSIGSFNRASKATTFQTPTEVRKTYLAMVNN
ncbi:MAG: hypothetical protein ABJH72_06480 [Reichenbachiella sp.]|uniref:hypothetical protein n=1 Tax=Reichenbachiella sp. TaxID=2184521 RepID=UPI0032674959